MGGIRPDLRLFRLAPPRRGGLFAALLCLTTLAPGCAKPNLVNNKLRAENQQLQEQLDALKRQVEADRATIKSTEQRVGTLERLPQDRLDKLVTVYGIKLGRLTGGDDWDPDKPGDDGLKVAVQPIDRQGDKLKAAGSFVVDVFDLASPAGPDIGHWTFDLDQAAQQWYGSLLYSYVLKCPWQKKVPAHNELTVRVTFTDELTGRQFTQQQVCKVNPPISQSSTTQPTSRP